MTSRFPLQDFGREIRLVIVMAALVAAIHVLVHSREEDVDGRDEPGHGDMRRLRHEPS